LHTSISVVTHTVFSIKGNEHSYSGGAKLEHRVCKLLKEDNKNNSELITTELVQQVISSILKVVTRGQLERFFSRDEYIEKMKNKTFSLAKLGEAYKDLVISYHTMVASTEIFFSQSDRNENENIAWMI